MKINTGANWGNTKVPKLRQIPSTSSAVNNRNVPSTARDSHNRNGYEDIRRSSGSLSARESYQNQKRGNQVMKTKKIIKNVNTRTALAAKIKALSQLDLNSYNNSNKPTTPKQQIPAFRRAYKLSNENGNVTRNSKPEVCDASSDEEIEDMHDADGSFNRRGGKKPFQDNGMPPPGIKPNTKLSKDKIQMMKWKKHNLTQQQGKGTHFLSKKENESREGMTTFSAPKPANNNNNIDDNVAYRNKIQATKSKMESEVYAKDIKIKNLKKRLESNDHVVQAKIKKISELEIENKKMKEQLGAIDKNHKVSLKQKVNEVMSLKRVVAAFNVEKNASSKEKTNVAKIESECQALRAQVTKLAAELHEKNEQLNDTNVASDVKRLNKNIKGLQGERESLITQINAMKGALGVQKLRIGELEERLKIEVRNHNKDHATEEAKVRELQNKYNDLYKKWQAQKSVTTNQFKLQDEKEKEALNDQIAKLKKEIEKLKKDNSKQKTKYGKLSNQLKAEQNVVKDLREKLGSIDILKTKVDELTKLYSTEKQTNEGLQRKIRELEAKFAVQLKKLNEKHAKELLEEKSQNDILRKELRDLKEKMTNDNEEKNNSYIVTINDLRGQLEKLRKTNETILYNITETKQEKDMLNKRCESQQITIANQSTEIGKLQANICTLENEKSILMMKLKKMEEAKDNAESELKSFKKEFDDLKHQHLKLTVQYEAGKDSIKRQAKEIDDLKAEVRKLKAELSGNSNNNTALLVKKQQLTDELNVANEKISDLLLERKKMQEALNNATRKMEEINGDSASSNKQLLLLETKMKELQVALKEAQSDLEAMTQKYKKAQQLGKNAIKEAVGYKSDLQALQKKLKDKDELVIQMQKDLENARKLNREKDLKIKNLEAALKELKQVLKSKANISQALEKKH